MKITQRTVDAATAPRVEVRTPASPFAWGAASAPTSPIEAEPMGAAPAAARPLNAFETWSAGGSASSAPTTAATPQENTMTERKKPGRKPGVTKGATPRFRMLSALMAHGPLTRADLLKRADITAKEFANSFFSAKKDQQAVMQPDGTYAITDAGREWTSGGSNLDNHKAPARVTTSPRAVKRGRRTLTAKGSALPKSEQQRLGVIEVKRKRGGAVVPVADLVSRWPAALASRLPAAGGPKTFRCAVLSDGSFLLQKNEISIELEFDESMAMLHYLERMAITEEPTAAAA